MIPNSTPAAGDADNPNRDKRPCVLFVDDERRVLTSMRAMFRRHYEVVLANSAVEALEVLQERPVHVVVSDQRMPEMTGVQLLTRIRNKRPETMRILLTGYADLDAIEASINESEVFRYLMKPCPPDELKDAVQLAVEAALSGWPDDAAAENEASEAAPEPAVAAPDTGLDVSGSDVSGRALGGTIVLFAGDHADHDDRAFHGDESEAVSLQKAQTDEQSAAAHGRPIEDQADSDSADVETTTAADDAAQSANDESRGGWTEIPAVANCLLDAYQILADEHLPADVWTRPAEVGPDVEIDGGVATEVIADAAVEVDPEAVAAAPGADVMANAIADAQTESVEPAAPDTEFLVLSGDMALVDTIRRAAGAEHRVVHAEVMELAVQLLATRPVGVLVTDIATDERGLTDLTATLKREVPELVTIIVSERSDAATMINLINHGQIFRFLLKPLQEAQTGIWLRSAIERFDSLCGDRHRVLRHRVVEMPTEEPTSQGMFAGLKARVARLRSEIGAAIAAGSARMKRTARPVLRAQTPIISEAHDEVSAEDQHL